MRITLDDNDDNYYAEELDLEDAEHQEMYLQVGYFIGEYSTCEIVITALLAILANFKDHEAFHILTKGLDGKTKVERLYSLAAPKKLIKDKGELDLRLGYFSDNVSKLRNKVAHSWLIKSKYDPQKIFFSNIAMVPLESYEIERKGRKKPDEMLIDILYEYSNWLRKFQLDLISLIDPAKKGAKLELKNPNSMEPTVFRSHLEIQEKRAKERTRYQDRTDK